MSSFNEEYSISQAVAFDSSSHDSRKSFSVVSVDERVLNR